MIKISRSKLRFPGFKGVWRKRKLGECCSINKGQQLSKKDMLFDGNYYVLNGGIKPSGYIDKYNTDKYTISISEGGNSCGYINFNTEKFWSGGHNYTLSKLKVNLLFLYQFLKANEKFIMSLRIGSCLPNIQKNRLEVVDVCYPTESEQQKIGTFFSKLDTLITLQQNKIEAIKKYKAGMLQKMFPREGETVPEIRFPGFTEEGRKGNFLIFSHLSALIIILLSKMSIQMTIQCQC